MKEGQNTQDTEETIVEEPSHHEQNDNELVFRIKVEGANIRNNEWR